MKPTVRTAMSRLDWRVWRIQSPYRALLGILLVFFGLGGGFISAMHNITTEIVDGPNRPLEMVAVSGDSWLLQQGTNNLVDDSYVDKDVVDQLRDDGYEAISFTRSYRAVQVGNEVHESMILDIPPALDEGELGVVVDRTFDLPVGSTISIGGQDFVITGVTSGTSALGKEGVFLSPEQFDRLGGSPDLVTGVFIRDGLPSEYGSDYAVYSAEEFEQLNHDYWYSQGGALPLLVAQMVNVYSFAVVMCLLALAFSLTRKAVVNMRAIGATVFQVMLVELLYLCVVWILSLPLQVFIYWLLVGSSKSSTPGYLGRLTASEFVWGAGGMLAVIGIYFLIMMGYCRYSLADRKLASQL